MLSCQSKHPLTKRLRWLKWHHLRTHVVPYGDCSSRTEANNVYSISQREKQSQGFCLKGSSSSESLWFHSKANMLLTVLSHSLDDMAESRTEPEHISSRQTPSEATAGIPASKTSVKPNKRRLESSSLCTWQLVALGSRNKALRSAESRFNKPGFERGWKFLSLCSFGFYHLCFSSPGQTPPSWKHQRL